MASSRRKPLSEFARFHYNFETSFVADALLDPILSQLPLHGFETDKQEFLTRLFNKQQVIISAEALHLYERVSVEQQKAVLSILAGGKDKTLKEGRTRWEPIQFVMIENVIKSNLFLNNCIINLYM